MAAVGLTRINSGIGAIFTPTMSSNRFEVQAPFQPAGDQPKAIAELTAGLRRGDRYQTLLGVTGSGKTMTLAHTIANYGKPTLVLSHNKTLAAQLYGELRQFLPKNAVEYFVCYYDYYQPEAYVPSTDVYIEKDASINAGHREPAAPGHLQPDGARRRGHRRHRERDLRPGRSGGVPEADGDGAAGRAARPRRRPGGAGPDPVLAQRRLVRAGHLPGARRFGGDLPGVRRAGDPDRVLGRRGRAHQQDQPAHRRHHRPDSTSAPSIRRSTSSPSDRRSSGRSG